ncbi:hypothetical protein BU15DRAFT_77141 [Melanogaster broomeanus]|nr:hypothetical protein BU15DRAFT_77141 [Melanogaster broomeanus]
MDTEPTFTRECHDDDVEMEEEDSDHYESDEYDDQEDEDSYDGEEDEDDEDDRQTFKECMLTALKMIIHTSLSSILQLTALLLGQPGQANGAEEEDDDDADDDDDDDGEYCDDGAVGPSSSAAGSKGGADVLSKSDAKIAGA